MIFSFCGHTVGYFFVFLGCNFTFIMERPLILISNDDGYQAKGLAALVDMVKRYGDVFVVAPDSARSGASMSISAHNPVRNRLVYEGEGLTIWACSGTPNDCVKMAFEVLLPRRPDLVLGGINHGNNCAINAHYSGTVSIAMEGCIKNVPSVAFSSGYMEADANFEGMRPVVEKVVEHVLTKGLPMGVCLNVNAPAQDTFKGIKIQKMGMGDWHEEWQEATHPHNWKYYWIAGYYQSYEPENTETDTWAFDNGYVAITPLQLDMTAYAALNELKILE